MRCPLILNCAGGDHEQFCMKFVSAYKIYAPTLLKRGFFKPNEGAMKRIRSAGMLNNVVLYPLVIFRWFEAESHGSAAAYGPVVPAADGI